MTESRAYIHVADRALEAAEGALARRVHEKAGFLAYHAFECTGGAFCSARGVPYPARNHPAKIRAFVGAVKRERFGQQAAQLAIAFGSLRNLLLYPRSLQNGRIETPEQVISEVQAKRLIARARSLAIRVKPGL